MGDSIARILALAALEAAQGGSGGRGINNVYISNGHLHIVFTDGLDSDVGRVVGEDGAVYKPSIITDEDGRRILHWEIVEEPDEVPEDTVLRMERAEWTMVNPNALGDKYSEIEWKQIPSGEDNSLNLNNSPEYTWDTI